MANGKSGDHPLTDILIYKVPVFSKRIDGLIQDLAKLASMQELYGMFDWFNLPPHTQFQKMLQEKLTFLKKDRKSRGWET